MAFSAYQRRLLLEWIQSSIEAGTALPDDAAIAGKFGFDSTQVSRELLADLSDRGEITIRGAGPDRAITLGRARPGAMPAAPRPVPSVRKPIEKTADVDRTVTRIMNIVAGGSKGARAAAAGDALRRPAPAADPTPARTAQIAEIAKKDPPETAPVVAASPAPTRPPRRQVAPVLSEAAFAELGRRAAVTGETVTGVAARILTETLTPSGKVFMPAGATQAAQAVGASVHDFASMLIKIGLENYLREEAA